MSKMAWTSTFFHFHLLEVYGSVAIAVKDPEDLGVNVIKDYF
jgi:hypothetical protein